MYLVLCKKRVIVQGTYIEIIFIHDFLWKRLSSQIFWLSKMLQEHTDVLNFQFAYFRLLFLKPGMFSEYVYGWEISLNSFHNLLKP